MKKLAVTCVEHQVLQKISELLEQAGIKEEKIWHEKWELKG